MLLKKIRIRIDRCLGCKACEIACAKEHSSSDDLAKAVRELPKPLSRIKIERGVRIRDEEERRPPFGESRRKLPKRPVYALRCRHCEEPRCVDACITGALRKEKDGTVIHDPEKCVGCWMCIMACPYGAIKRNVEAKIIVKCDLCPQREVPACVETCKTGALELVIVDDASQESLSRQLVEETG